MNIVFVGCGFVSEFYAKTLGNYPDLSLIGVYDRNAHHLEAFCRRWKCRAYTSLDETLADPSVEMILNLTNPRSHFEVTRNCLKAGKHVYSEKPLAMNFNEARELADLAKFNNLYLAAAPCSLLSETAQTVAKALRDGVVGKVRLVYANFDDGMIAPNLAPWNWRNETGIIWPAQDEFEVGCTYEHAGYVLTWLAAFFGPAKSVTAFACCQIPDKGISVVNMAPDFTVGCVEYEQQVVARVTCSLIAPKDRSLTIVGDDGILYVADVRNDTCPVYLRPIPQRGWRAGAERRIAKLRKLFGWGDPVNNSHFRRRLPFVRRPPGRFVSATKAVDFCRGPSEMASAIRQRRPSRLSPELAVHLVEIVEALQYPERFGGRRELLSTFSPIEPLPCYPVV